MTDLTEQWKKGKLPEGDYYISNGDEIYSDYYDSAEGFLKTYNYGVRRILAEVPDYVEWQAKLEENAQLKELLRKWVQFEIEENPIDFTVMSERMSGLANKTKEVLK